MEVLTAALIGFLAMGIISGTATGVQWAVTRWRGECSWRLALMITIVIMLSIGPLFALLDGTLSW